MSISRRFLLAGAMSAGLTAVSGKEPARDETDKSTASELTGILHVGEMTILPYLTLDGSNERCYVLGPFLREHITGERLRAKGVLRTKLFDYTGTDWRKAGAPQQPPFIKGWVVYLDVTESRVISAPFEQ